MNDSVALAPVEPQTVELGVMHARTPQDLVTHATACANALAPVIEDRKLFTLISGKRHVRCEGWTTLAMMLGVTPHEVNVVEGPEGTFTATVELRRLSDGSAVSRASAECGTDEPTWRSRSRNARRSMALTRATGKACRLAFSWIMALAGYEATPAEEMTHDAPEPPQEARTSPEPSRITVPFGSGKVWPIGSKRGTPLTKLTVDELVNGRQWCLKQDPNKWADLINDVQEELERRRSIT